MSELDRTRIVEVALDIARRAGPDGLTMRAVADGLGVTATALYHHVADKKALITLMVDAVVAEQVLPDPTGDWREDLFHMTCAMREMSMRHPAVSELRRGHQIRTDTILPLTERWMSLWIQSGLPLDAALRAGVLTSHAVTGIVDQEQQRDRVEPPAESSLSWAPNARAALNAIRDPAADFELLVRALIDGVHRRLVAEGQDGQEPAAAAKRSAARRARRASAAPTAGDAAPTGPSRRGGRGGP